MVDHAMIRFRRLDCLVNNAGSGSPMVSTTEVAAEHFSSVFNTNVRGAMALVCAAAYPSILTVGPKRRSFICSADRATPIAMQACRRRRGNPPCIPRNVASEISSRGVLVNTISPGSIVTGIFARNCRAGRRKGGSGHFKSERLDCYWRCYTGERPRSGRRVCVAWCAGLASRCDPLFSQLDDNAGPFGADAATALAGDGRTGGGGRHAAVWYQHCLPCFARCIELAVPRESCTVGRSTNV